MRVPLKLNERRKFTPSELSKMESYFGVSKGSEYVSPSDVIEPISPKAS